MKNEISLDENIPANRDLTTNHSTYIVVSRQVGAHKKRKDYK